MDHSSTSTCPVKFANLVEVLHHATPTCLSWFMGPFSLVKFSPNFSIKGGSKFGVILLNCGRWWHAQCLFFLLLAWRIFYNLTYLGKLNTKDCTSALPWIGASYFIVKVWHTSGILGSGEVWFLRMGGSAHQILLCICLSQILSQTTGTLWCVLW